MANPWDADPIAGTLAPGVDPWLDAGPAAEGMHGLPGGSVAGLLAAERTSPGIVSSAGAATPLQILPSTAREMGMDPKFLAQNPSAATYAGAAYLAKQYKAFGNLPDAYAAYNAGPANAQRWIAAGRPSDGAWAGVSNYVDTATRAQGGGTAPAPASAAQADATPWANDPIAPPASGPRMVGLKTTPGSTGPNSVLEAAEATGKNIYDTAGNIMNEMVRGATFGLSDKGFAAADAGISKLEGDQGNFGDLYEADLAAQRKQAADYEAKYPVGSRIAQGAGLVMGARWLPGLTAPTFMGRVAQAAVQGGLIGAASTAAQTNDQAPLGTQAKQIGIGTVTGTALGAVAPFLAEKVVAPIFGWLAQKFGFTAAADNGALEQLGSRLQQDVKAGGPTAQDMLDSVNEAERLGKPVMLADVGGENVQGLGERLATTPGQSRAIASQALNQRDAGAGLRLAADINQGLDSVTGGDVTAFDMGKALQQAKVTAAAPLYEKAYAATPISAGMIEPGGALDDLMSRPSMQQAAQRALAIAKEEGTNPASLGITFNAAGDPEFTSVPSWKTLDYLKRGLDDTLGQYREPLTGRLNLDEQGRAVQGTLSQFRALLIRQNPAYGEALNAWSGPSSAQAAIRMGMTVLSKQPGQIADDLANLSDADKEFYKLGVADSLKTVVAKTGAAGDEARRLVGNDYVKAQLRPLFSSDEAFNRFVDAATIESKMFQTKGMMLGNSRTAIRLAESAASQGEGGALQPLLEGAAAAGTGEPILALKAAGSGLQKLMGYLNRPSPEVDAATARMLFSASAPANREILGRLMAEPPIPIPFIRAPFTALAAPAAGRFLGASPQ